MPQPWLRSLKQGLHMIADKAVVAIRSALLALLVAISCHVSAAGSVPGPEQQERDEILSLAALAVVHRDWQVSPFGRGHNIGAILAGKNSVPVFWARNTVNMSGNATQHGEVRLIQEFLDCKGVDRYANGYTVYTTLEPCAMCTGMMALTMLGRAVYVQSDPEFGNARDALASIDYPRIFEEYSPPNMRQKRALDAGYENFRKQHPRGGITAYLLSPEAKSIFASAETELQSYKPRFQENVRVVEAAKQFLKSVPQKAGDDRPSDYCPLK